MPSQAYSGVKVAVVVVGGLLYIMGWVAAIKWVIAMVAR